MAAASARVQESKAGRRVEGVAGMVVDERGELVDATCHVCGKRFPCWLTYDPFVFEVRGIKTEPAYWCRQCWKVKNEDT